MAKVSEISVERQRFHRFGMTIGDQIVSAFSNFAIAIVAARLLTHGGFGAFSVGITVFILVVGACRDTIGDMVLVRATARGLPDDRTLWSSATGAALIVGLLMAFVVAAAGAALGGATGHALLAVAAVLPGLTVQDILRHCFVAGSRAGAALANDLFWLAVMVPSVLLAHAAWGASAAVLLLAWGIAGNAAALLGCLQGRVVPGIPSGVRWILRNRRQATHYLGEFVSVRGASQIAILGLGPVAGVSAVGATRGAFVFFGPLTVAVTGLHMALTSDATSLRSEPERLMRRVALSSVLAAVAATAWTLVGVLIPDAVGRAVLGSTWSSTRPLILVTGIGLAAASAITGPLSGLRALRASHHSFYARVWSFPLMLILSLSLASGWGAKGFAVGSAIESTITLGLLSWAFARANSLRGSARENIAEGGGRRPRRSGQGEAGALRGERARGGTALLPVLLGLGCGIVIAFVDGTAVGLLVVAAGLVALGVFLIVGRSWSITSAPILIASAYIAVSVLAPLLLPRLRSAKAVSAILRLSEADTKATTLLLVVAALSVLVGATVHELATTLQPGRVAHAKLPPRLRSPLRILAITAIPAFVLVVGVGPVNVIHKQRYLEIAGSRQLVSLGTALSLPAAALASCVLFSSATRKVRRLGALVLLTYGMLFFALGSRQLALLPALVMVGWLLSEHRGKQVWPRMVAAVCATIILFPLPLSLRSSPSHGLQPYAQRVVTDPSLLFSPDLRPLLNNLLFSFPLTGYVAYTKPPIPTRIFWVMVNPLPGAASGWLEVLPGQRINPYTPFNALGQLGNFGWAYLAGYFVAVGWYFAHLQQSIRKRLPVGWQSFAHTTATGIAGLFAVTSLQYSLRTATRLIYYSIFLELFLRFAVIPLLAPLRRTHHVEAALRVPIEASNV